VPTGAKVVYVEAVHSNIHLHVKAATTLQRCFKDECFLIELNFICRNEFWLVYSGPVTGTFITETPLPRLADVWTRFVSQYNIS
jgi:hypothetical protein